VIDLNLLGANLRADIAEVDVLSAAILENVPSSLEVPGSGPFNRCLGVGSVAWLMSLIAVDRTAGDGKVRRRREHEEARRAFGSHPEYSGRRAITSQHYRFGGIHAGCNHVGITVARRWNIDRPTRRWESHNRGGSANLNRGLSGIFA